MSLETFGMELRRCRERAGLSLRELAHEATDVTSSYLGILENAKNPRTSKPSRPSVALVLRLARALNLDGVEAVEFAEYAGYDLTESRDHEAVASMLRNGRRPAIFQQLRELETELGSYVEQLRLVEAPIFTVLGELDRDSAEQASTISILGRAFRAWTRPARLFCVAKKRGSLDEAIDALRTGGGPEGLQSPLTIGVQGQLMTPTALLLRHLDRVGLPYKVENLDRTEASFSSRNDERGMPVAVEVFYSEQAQIEFLKRDGIDLALIVYPYQRVEDDNQFEAIDEIDLWVDYRAAKLPMSIMVAPTADVSSLEGRRTVIERMDAIRHQNRLLLRRGTDEALDNLVRKSGDDEYREPAMVLDAFPDPYLDEQSAQLLSVQLARLSELGEQIGLLQHRRAPDFYRPFIRTMGDLINFK